MKKMTEHAPKPPNMMNLLSTGKVENLGPKSYPNSYPNILFCISHDDNTVTLCPTVCMNKQPNIQHIDHC